MINTDGKLDIKKILEDLENYVPKRRGWVWRKKTTNLKFNDILTAIHLFP